MRTVLHIVPALFSPDDGIVGGAERYVLELARHMADAVPTRLVTFGARDRQEQTGRLQIRVIGKPWLVRGQRSNPFSLALFDEVRRATVVHCHQQHVLSSSFAAAAARILRRRVYCTDLGGGGWDISAYVSTDRLYHGHLHISEYSRLIAGHTTDSRAHVVWGGVDTEKFSPGPGTSTRDGVLFVGRLLPHKGLDTLIRALPTDLSAQILGPVADARYERDLRELAAGKRVTFRHDCDDAALVEAYRASSCIVLPSVYRDIYGDETKVPELLGQTLLEGMSTGLPAVCTSVASLPEIVRNGHTGLVVPPSDPVSLGEALRWLRDHPARARAMGEAARASMLARFSWPTVVQRCLTVYGLREHPSAPQHPSTRAPQHLSAQAPQHLSGAPKHPAGVCHVVTCEYPPQVGGVSDFAATVAAGLASSGQTVHVWCPPAGKATGPVDEASVVVHQELGSFRQKDWRRVGAILDRFPRPRRLLVQWVPHGYGYRSMNLPFALWLALRALRHGDTLEIVVHEPFLAWSAHPLRLATAFVHRIMLVIAAAGASRIWISIPAWERAVRPFVRRGLPIQWLPVPSPLRMVVDPIGVSRVRQRLAPRGERLVGHFSTHSPLVTSLLGPAMERLLASDNVRITLIGRDSDDFARAFVSERPRFASRVEGTGILEPSDLSRHLQACDVVLQPYPDGVSTRRTTAIALLAHGQAIVTNEGALSESLWRESGAVALASAPDAASLASEAKALLGDDARRASLKVAARRLDDRLFDIRHTIAALTDLHDPSPLVCTENLAS